MIAINGAGMSGWIDLVRAEYREMPGLSLTKPQMQRLWGTDAVLCDALIETLVLARIIRKTRDEHYLAFDSAQ